MSELVALIKAKLNYTTRPKICKGCKYFSVDMTTDNFGHGDTCRRNPDATFSTDQGSVCDGWRDKSVTEEGS